MSWTGSVATTYNGDQTTVTDQAGKKRRSTVNSLGQLVQVDELNADGSLYAATNYSYDARGNLLSTTQVAGAITQTRRFAYDALSRLLFAANPEQNTSSNSIFTYNGQQWAVKYVYDVASNLTDKTDTRPVDSQFVNTHYDYDSLNRVSQRSYNDGTPQVNYVYDTATNGVGRLRSMTASGVSTYNYTSYDALGRPTAYNQVTEGQTYLMSCTYNKAGMMMDETYPSGRVMHTEYDDAGRPAGVKKITNSFYYAGGLASDAVNRVQYSAHGAMSAMKLGNSLWEHENFNSRLQPTQIGLGTGQTSSSVLGLDYTYGVLVSGSLDATKNNGNLQSQTITLPGAIFVQSYVYDQVNRLASVQETFQSKPMWVQTYTFDRWGNRTSLVNSGAKAQYLPTQNTPPVDSATNRLAGSSYDAAGSKLSGWTSVTYDAENRLTRLREPGALRFTYDGDGRRVEKINDEGGPEIIVFVYNAAGQMVAEYSSTAYSLPNVKVSYLTADHLSSTRVVTDGTGTLVARHDYMPYGEDIPLFVARYGIPGYGAADGVRQKFTQKERDSESGLDYFLARYYSSAQGRFTSPDEFTGEPDKLYYFVGDASANPTFYADIFDPQTLNKYQYCLGNPLRYIDPDGHSNPTQTAEALRAASAAAAGARLGARLGAWGLAAGVVAGLAWEYRKEIGEVLDYINKNGGEEGPTSRQIEAQLVEQDKARASAQLHTQNKPPNPNGQQGAQDHQDEVQRQTDKAQQQAKPGETVQQGKRIKGVDSTRRPDVQTVGPDGKVVKVVEVERRPSSRCHRERQKEYDRLNVPHETVPLPKKKDN